ncbi:fimbrial protein [Paraburkholderia caffeinilytica]|uniref:fimbrial protein n=1 Tax=Paraburkholderia caffeinilytica TaxID=1761016 RepID=UPI0038B98F65
MAFLNYSESRFIDAGRQILGRVQSAPRNVHRIANTVLLRLALALCIGAISVSAHANLTCEVASINKAFVAGVISVPMNTAVGATVSTLAPDAFQLTCKFLADGLSDTSATLFSDFTTTGGLAPGFTDVYKTGIPGLGVRYMFNSPQCNANNLVLSHGTVRISCPFSGPLNGPIMTANVTVTSSLVVTDTIAAGASTLSTVPSVTIIYSTSDGGSSYWNKGSLYTGSATGVLTRATCSVNQTNVAVLMPTADTRVFSSVGAVAAPQPFSLAFSCATGAKVSITLTDNVNPSNRSTALQLSPDSTARGIGVQILNSSGTPVSFGPDSAAPGNTNQWLIGNSPNGTLQVPLTARYVRTGAVSAGTVKALATFTMSYQ